MTTKIATDLEWTKLHSYTDGQAEAYEECAATLYDEMAEAFSEGHDQTAQKLRECFNRFVTRGKMATKEAGELLTRRPRAAAKKGPTHGRR